MNAMELTKTQSKVLRWLCRANNGQMNLAGNCQVHYIVSARSLVKRGLAIEFKTSTFSVTKEGRELYEEIEKSQNVAKP